MKHYYSTVDDVVLTYSDITEENGIDVIYVRLERANDKGFDFAEMKIPNYSYYKSFGFSEDELMLLERYVRNNTTLIWQIAKDEKDGEKVNA